MRKLAFRLLTLVLLSLGLQPLGVGLVHAQGDSRDTKIGVTVSAVINAKPQVGPRVGAVLGKALGETLKASILSGPDAQARLPEEARSETCLGEATCLVSAGKALGVDQLLMLIIIGVGDELKIEATWVNVATGETALRPGITTADSDDALWAAFTSKASELLPGVTTRASDSTGTASNTGTAGTTGTTGTTSNSNTSTGSGASVNSTVPSNQPATSGNRTAKILMIGGGVAVAGYLGYGAYRLSQCGEIFGCKDDPATDRFGQDLTVDVLLGGLGTVALSAGLYMYLSSDEEAASPAPVGFNVGSDSFQLSYGGSF